MHQRSERWTKGKRWTRKSSKGYMNRVCVSMQLAFHIRSDCSVQLMAIETPEEYGGANCSFTSAIIAIEELAKIDPSVSVLCDVHNTLVNTIFRTYGTPEQKEKFLSMLSNGSVSIDRRSIIGAMFTSARRSVHSAFRNRLQARTHLPCRHVLKREGTSGS